MARHRSPARLLALAAFVGLCGLGLLTQVNKRRILYRTPFAEALPWGEGGTPLSDRVVFCLVDGLREDTSRTLASLNNLRAQGADWTVTATDPTASVTLSHVIATGAPQTTIGLLDNKAPIGPGFYTVFGNIYTAAKQAGLRTGNVVTWRPGYPLAQHLDAPNTLPGAPGDADDDGLVPRVLEVLGAEPRVNLLWVHFDIVDHAGHAAGADSDAYRSAAEQTAERIGQIARAMDLSRETLIVTADHGHLDGGGHHGMEPEVATVPCVLVGAGIRRGASGKGEQIDLASTVAVLLGTPIPTHNQGWPLMDALDAPPEVVGRRARDVFLQRFAEYRFRLNRLGITDKKLDAPMPYGIRVDTIDLALERGAWSSAYAEGRNLSMEMHSRWLVFLDQVRDAHLRPRIYAATACALFALAASVVLRKRAVAAGNPPAQNPPLWVVAGIAVAVLAPPLLYLAGGHAYSLSWPGRSGVGPFALPRLVEGAAGLCMGYGVARFLARREARGTLPFGGVLATVAGGMAGAAAVGGGVYVLGFGFDPQPWHTTSTPIAILLVSALHMAGVALVALPAAVVVAARHARAADG